MVQSPGSPPARLLGPVATPRFGSPPPTSGRSVDNGAPAGQIATGVLLGSPAIRSGVTCHTPGDKQAENRGPCLKNTEKSSFFLWN